MDIKSPSLLKIKAALFVVIALLSTGLLAAAVFPMISWRIVALFSVCIWACCRAYYFCFYVMEHYADPAFRYAGLWDLFQHLVGVKRKSSGRRAGM